MRIVVALLAPALLAAQSPDSLFRIGKFDDARVAAEARFSKNKTDADAAYWVGRALFSLGKESDAGDWFEKCVKLQPNSAPYHFWLGQATGREAQKANKLRQPFLAKKVQHEFEKAVDLDPKYIDARDGLVGFYSQAPGFMGGSIEKAKQQAGEISKLSPYRGHLAMYEITESQNDTAGMIRAYEGAIAAAPDSTNTYYRLAVLYRRMSRFDDAWAIYEKLMVKAPQEPVPHLGWGVVAVVSGKNLERGEKELKLFLASATVEKVGIQNLAGGHFRLGNVYEKTARKELAKAAYQEALKINPNHTDAKKALDALK